MHQANHSISRSLNHAIPNLPSWLIVVYAALICTGVALLRAPGMLIRGNELSATEAIFAAVNAATLTGFEPRTSLDHYTFVGQCVLLGLIAGGTLISLIAGGILVVRIVNLPVDERKLIRRAGALFGAGTIAGTALLWNGDRSLFDALFLACSAIGNCGLVTGFAPPFNGWAAHAVVLPLAFIGALGLPVIVELIATARGRQRELSLHSRTALVGMLGVYLIGTVILWLLAAGGGSPVHETLISASAASLDARTGGFGYATPEGLTRAAQWGLMVLMIIGGASGGTAGGVKVTTCATIATGAQRSLAGKPPGRSLGIALVWIGIYLGLLLLGMLALLSAQPQIPGDRMLFEAISAVSNVGVAYGPVSMTGPGMYALCLLMLAGRFLPIFVLLWMARTTHDADVAVG